MGATAGPAHAPVDGFESDARDELLEELVTAVTELGGLVGELADHPDSQGVREDLIARLRSLALRAQGEGEIQLSEKLRACRVIVQSTALLQSISDRDRQQIDEALERITVYARTELEREHSAGSGPLPAVAAGRRRRARAHGVLRLMVVGSRKLVEALRAEDWAVDDEAPALELERVSQVGKARAQVAERQPDVVVVDTDLESGVSLVQMLLADEHSDSIPVVALGSWTHREQAAQLVAAGAARCVSKPTPPGNLRRACLDVAPHTRGEAFEPVGNTTIDELSTRLAGEVHRWLSDATEPAIRAARVDLGEGADLLTVMWDAIGRVRQLVTAKSQGQIRFRSSERLRALPAAPWLARPARRHLPARSPRSEEARGPVGDAALQGMRVLIAEDDPSTNWFISGVLREAGAQVSGALDGAEALERAYRVPPDLVLADVTLPGVDGLSLCARLRDDLLLRTVPVVLLAARPELLQRARELGVGAHGYLLRDVSAERIVQRLSELLTGRQRMAVRMAEDHAMRGRLDGLGVHDVLRATCRVRPDARVTVRDAGGVYQIEIRGGRPVCATYAATSGGSARGPAVFGALLAVGDGSFAVEAAADGEVAAVELEGTLQEQICLPLARARAAQRLLEQPTSAAVQRVTFDQTVLRAQLDATPEPAQGLLRALAGGASPTHLARCCSADLLRAVLRDAARQGVIAAVLDHDGGDMLAEACEQQLAALRGEAAFAPEQLMRRPPAWQGVALQTAGPELVATPSAPAAAPSTAERDQPAAPSDAALPALEDDWDSESDDAADSSAAEGRAPEPPAAVIASDEPEPCESSEEPGRVSLFDRAPLGRPSRPPPSAPPPAHTPVLASVEVTDEVRRHTPVLSSAVDAQAMWAQLDPQPGEPRGAAPAEDASAPPRPAPARRDSGGDGGGSDAPDPPRLPRVPMPSAYATHHPVAPRRSRSVARYAVPLLFGAVGITLAVGARWMREHPGAGLPGPLAQPTPPAAVQTPTVDQQPAVDPALRPAAAARAAERPASTEDLPVELPLSKKDAARLHQGEGLLEVVAGRNDEIHVDKKLVGKGPTRKIVLAARDKPYEVRVKLRGEERVRYVVVLAGKRLRLRVAPPWSR